MPWAWDIDIARITVVMTVNNSSSECLCQSKVMADGVREDAAHRIVLSDAAAEDGLGHLVLFRSAACARVWQLGHFGVSTLGSMPPGLLGRMPGGWCAMVAGLPQAHTGFAVRNAFAVLCHAAV
jgi:hypothetical protein